MKLLRVSAQSVTDHVPFIRGYSHIVFSLHLWNPSGYCEKWRPVIYHGWAIESRADSLMWTTFALFPECTRFPCWTQKCGFLSWYPTRWMRLAHNICVLCDRGTSEEMEMSWVERCRGWLASPWQRTRLHSFPCSVRHLAAAVWKKLTSGFCYNIPRTLCYNI